MIGITVIGITVAGTQSRCVKGGALAPPFKIFNKLIVERTRRPIS